MFFGRASDSPVPFSFPSSYKLDPQVSFPKSSQARVWGQEKQPESASSPCYSIRHGPNIYGSQSTSSSVHYVHYALKHLPFRSSTALLGLFIPTTSSPVFPLSLSACLSICISLCLCGESSGIRWTRRSSQRDGLFSALNEIWQLEYAIHDLIYPPNWKAREELNAREGSAVCFADLGQLSYSTLDAFCVLCVELKMGDVYSWLVVLEKLSQDVI